MAISRNIQSLWITDYDKSIGDVGNYLDSGSGYSPFLGSFADRSTVTGVRQITVGAYFWGQTALDTTRSSDQTTTLDEDLVAGDTTITVVSAANFDASVADPGYIAIENEVIKYTGSTATTLTGCVRGQLDTTDVQHDGTASTIYVYGFMRGVIQSIDYEPEDEVYGVRVALPYTLYVDGQTLKTYPTIWRIYRFEFSKHVVDLVLYEDVELPTSITGSTPGYPTS